MSKKIGAEKLVWRVFLRCFLILKNDIYNSSLFNNMSPKLEMRVGQQGYVYINKTPLK